MNKSLYKIVSILFGFISLGAISETQRIMTSTDLDIAPQRTYLTVMAIFFLIGFLFLTRYFWIKSKR